MTNQQDVLRDEFDEVSGQAVWSSQRSGGSFSSSPHQSSAPLHDKENTSQEPLVLLGIAGNDAVHRASIFLDSLVSSKCDRDAKMETYAKQFFGDLIAPSISPALDTSKTVTTKHRRTFANSIQVLDKIKLKKDVLPIAVAQYEEAEAWEAETAHEHVLQTVKANPVPKGKKNKKPKKKKKNLSEVTEDLMTPEEASITYQIAVAEERLKEQLLTYSLAHDESRVLEEEYRNVSKRYDQEIQAMRLEFQQADSDLKAAENEWSEKLHATEKEIYVIEDETQNFSRRLNIQIAEITSDILELKNEIRIWETFRDGQMVKNANTIRHLDDALQMQKLDEKHHLHLTEEVIVLSEEFAKESGKSALSDLCDRHVKFVSETLPPEELQIVEDRNILMAEISALNQIHEQLLRQTDDLQKKILHQTAEAQVLLGSVYADSTKLVKEKFGTQWKAEWTKTALLPLSMCSEMCQDFDSLGTVQARTGGLVLVGINVFRQKAIDSSGPALRLKLLAEPMQNDATQRLPKVNMPEYDSTTTVGTKETDVIGTVGSVMNAEKEIREDDYLGNYERPVLTDGSEIVELASSKLQIGLPADSTYLRRIS